MPELANVEDAHLVQPERMPPTMQQLAGCVIGDDYPAPIVEHATAYRAAKQQIFAVRGTPEARAEAKRVYERHGSRRRPPARRSR